MAVTIEVRGRVIGAPEPLWSGDPSELTNPTWKWCDRQPQVGTRARCAAGGADGWGADGWGRTARPPRCSCPVEGRQGVGRLASGLRSRRHVARTAAGVKMDATLAPTRPDAADPGGRRAAGRSGADSRAGRPPETAVMCSNGRGDRGETGARSFSREAGSVARMGPTTAVAGDRGGRGLGGDGAGFPTPAPPSCGPDLPSTVPKTQLREDQSDLANWTPGCTGPIGVAVGV